MTHAAPPVFSSFPDIEVPGGSSSRTNNSERHKSKVEKDKSKHKDRSDKDDKRRKKEHRHKEHREKDSSLRSEIEDTARSNDTSSSIYFRDRKGDNLIIAYGSLDAKRIPKYKHVGGEYYP